MSNNHNDKANFIWSVAELLRGPYTPNQYRNVMLPLTVLRRLDCVLEPARDEVLAAHEKYKNKGAGVLAAMLEKAAGAPFYNTSRYTFERLKGDPDNIAANLVNYLHGFSENARNILDHFKFEQEIAKLEQHNRLFQLVSRFSEIDLHPDRVPNLEMGLIFEELIRRFNEASNEEAGDHFTPREVIRLMVDLVFGQDHETLTRKGIVKTLYDPACGTGGMLSTAEEYLRQLNPAASLKVFGQDYNDQAFAVCGSDMMIKGGEIDQIAFGDSLTDDRFPQKRFDYMLANPPFGVEWKTQQAHVKNEHDNLGYNGRFGAGFPRVSDGSLLFLQHMISKMAAAADGGARLAIVFNGSPLFTGDAGSGESNIRQWIIENDWLEGIVALPDQLFYNTGIATYLWVVANRKASARRGKIQLVNGAGFFSKMRKSLGNKRHEISDEQRAEIVRLYESMTAGKHVRIFDNDEFGYRKITVERPLRRNYAVNEERLARLRESAAFQKLATSKKRKDLGAARREVAAGQALQERILAALAALAGKGVAADHNEFSDLLAGAFKDADVNLSAAQRASVQEALGEPDETAAAVTNSKRRPQPDPALRDNESVPLRENIGDYMEREVLPHAPDAWVDEAKTRVGYEISFNRYFYEYQPPRPLEEIEAELGAIEQEIIAMMAPQKAA